MKFSTKLICGFGFILIMFATVAFIKIELSRKVNDHILSVTKTGDVLRQSSYLQKLILNLETGFRGFLLTNRLEALEPYNKALPKLNVAFQQHEKLISGTREQQKLAQIEELLYHWLDSIANPLIEKNQSVTTTVIANPEYQALFKKNVGNLVSKRTMDTIKQQFAELDSIQNLEREKNKQILQASLAETDRLTLLLTMISILAAAAIAWLIIRNLTGSLKTMVVQAQNISQGKFDIMIPENNETELNKLVVSLNTMKERLHISFAELERSNKELENFAYVASHDLREPLRTISSFAQLLNKKLENNADKETNEYLGFIKDGSARMERLIADLLEYSRLGTQKNTFKNTDLNNVMKAVLQNLSVTITETNTKIEYSKLPVIKGDETQLIQLFQNLIANAIKFRHKETSPQIHISCKNTKDGYEFSVEDNGIGIPEDQRDRIFMIFQRLHSKDEYQGTGIGLAVCKKIAENHGGKIWCTSSPAGGAKFSFILKNDHRPDKLI